MKILLNIIAIIIDNINLIEVIMILLQLKWKLQKLIQKKLFKNKYKKN